MYKRRTVRTPPAPTRSRPRRWPALAALVALGLFPAPTSRVDKPQPVPLLTQRLSSFDTLYVAAMVDIGDVEPLKWMIHARSDGRIGVDSGFRKRHSWVDGHWYWAHPGSGGVRTKPSWDAVTNDLWPELRSGFAHSTWEERTPMQDGFDEGGGGYLYERLSLPFAWAAPISVYIAFNRNTYEPRCMMVFVPGRDRVIVHLDDVQWNPTLPVGVFDSDAPPFAPPLPAKWDVTQHYGMPYDLPLTTLK